MKFWALIFVLCCQPLSAKVWALESAAEQFPALELTNTHVHQLPAKNSDREYEVWVDLPTSYGKSAKKLPVLFVTDANYAFPLIRSIRNRLGANGQNIEDFVIVGLSYAKGYTPINSRSFDYTPTDVLARPKKPGESYGGDAYGGSALYIEYLRQQVIPFVLKNYQVDPKRKVFVGHSYGGLLGAELLLRYPDSFDSYIISSPSLWFDKKHLMKLVEARSKKSPAINATALLYAAEFEQIKPGARYSKEVDIVADLLKFEQLLKASTAPAVNAKTSAQQGLQIKSKIIADEDHLSVFPSMISRALVELLPGYGPYNPG